MNRPILLCAILITAYPAVATIHHVYPTDSIQTAVDSASPGDTVLVHDGTYTLSAPIEVTSAIRIESENGPDFTVIDGGGAVQCFDLSNVACVIDGLTVTNGYAAAEGGGIYCVGTEPIISNCIITGCSAENGGGIARGTVIDSLIVNNTASEGGGGLTYSIVINSRIISNQAGKYSGGLDFGSAENCLIASNHCGIEGGASYQSAITNCTIVGNMSDGDAGGLILCDTFNSIIVSNSAVSGFDDISNIGLLKFSCSPDVPTHGVDGNITNGPAFIDFIGGDYRLQTNSPCINTGDNGSSQYSRDLDGNVRISRHVVDMGAYEYQFIEVDTDSDGMNDYDEGIAGTNPNDPDSFPMVWVEALEPDTFVVSWNAFEGRIYTVSWTTNLIQEFVEISGDLPYPSNSYTHVVGNADSVNAYRVDVRLAQ